MIFLRLKELSDKYLGALGFIWGVADSKELSDHKRCLDLMDSFPDLKALVVATFL
jgi:hypothetical protein